MRITFYGAAGGVTGSKHLVQIGDNKILLDCGSFQGRRQLTRELNSQLPFKAGQITAVILSHGHLDHCGSLPLLIKQGYQGNIYATDATIDITRWILTDAAHIQQADKDYMARHRISGHELAEPIFTIDDVNDTMSHCISVPYASKNNTWFAINPNLRLKLYNAGHILGSAVILIEAKEADQTVRLAFTGDLGRKDTPLIKDPVYIAETVPTLIMEATYGNRVHQPIIEAIATLRQVIKATLANDGKIIVPAFALGRVQELIYLLHRMSDEGELKNLPIYIDSPLAAEITAVFKKHSEMYDQESWSEFGQYGETPLVFKNLRFVSSVEESKNLNTLAGPLMIISASGMCEAGRVVHHLINGLSAARNTILITGFQAEHTVGRRLVEGNKTIKLFGKKYGVKAQVVVLNELSAHADAPALLDYAQHISALKQIYLVHGENRQCQALRLNLQQNLPAIEVSIPQLNETVEI